MSGDILSNDEIAALVEAARSGQVAEGQAPASPRRPRRVRDVDFSRPTKFTQDQQRRLRRGHESFCRTVSTQLSAELRIPVELEVITVDQQTWSAALAEIPTLSLYAVLATSTGGRFLATLEQAAAMNMTERLLGGAASGQPLERELTEIEIALVGRIFNTIVGQLSRIWEELAGLSLSVAAVETQQASIQLAPSSEPTLSITIELQVERSSSTLTLLVPYRAIESVVPQLSAGTYGEHRDPEAEAKAEEDVRAALRAVEVEVRAEIGSLELTLDDVLALEPGDTVRLGVASAGGTLYADAVPTHRVKPGLSGNRRAVEVLEPIQVG